MLERSFGQIVVDLIIKYFSKEIGSSFVSEPFDHLFFCRTCKINGADFIKVNLTTLSF